MTENKEVTVIQNLEARLAQAEAQIAALSTSLEQYKAFANQCDDVFRRYLKLHDQEIAYAFERIQNLEFKSYPGLARDICQIDEVIGESDSRADNPLDRRSTSQQ